MSSSSEVTFDLADIDHKDHDTQQASNSQLFDAHQSMPNRGVSAHEMNLMKELCNCLSPIPLHEDVVRVPNTMDSILQEVYEYMGQEEEAKSCNEPVHQEERGDTDSKSQGELEQELRTGEERGDTDSMSHGTLEQELRTGEERDPAVAASQPTEDDVCDDACDDAELGNVLMMENALKILESMRCTPALEPAVENELENVLLLEKALKKVNGNLAELTAMSMALKRIENQEEEEDIETTDLERALEACPLIMDDEDFSRRFQTIEAWAAQQVEEEEDNPPEESGDDDNVATPRPESFRQEEEVTKSAKNLFAKKTKTLFHWLHPDDSKADLRMRVERAWHKLSQKESEFYYSQVLGPFNHRQVKPMINPRIFELLNLPMSARQDAAPQAPPPPHSKPTAAAKPVKPPKAPRSEPAPRKKRGPYNKTPKHLRDAPAAEAGEEGQGVKRHRGPNKKKKQASLDDDDEEEARKRKKKLKRERREEREENARKKKGCSEGSDDEDWNVARKRRKKARRERRRMEGEKDVMKLIARRYLRQETDEDEGESDNAASERKVIVERVLEEDGANVKEPPQTEQDYEISAQLTRDLAECDKMLDSDDSW